MGNASRLTTIFLVAVGGEVKRKHAWKHTRFQNHAYVFLSPSHCCCCRWRRRLREECGSHVRKEIESLEGQTPDCGAFLQLVDSKWQDHCSSMLTLRNVFLYLDRSFVLQTPSLRSIWDMGLELFRNFFQVLYVWNTQ